MTTSPLMLAILAMNAYDQGYGSGLRIVKGIDGIGPQIGVATVQDVPLPSTAFTDGFYAVAFTLADKTTVISYRGTDNASFFSNTTSGGGDFAAFPIALGSYSNKQATDAAQFYLNATAGAGNVVLTGHSLGGALAGFAAGLYGAHAVIFDNMPFEKALKNFADDLKGSGVFNLGMANSNAVMTQGLDSNASIQAAPNPTPNVTAYEVNGQFLQPFTLLQTPAPQVIDSHSGYFTLNPLTQLHSINLLVLLQWASDNSLTDWQAIGKSLWTAYFEEPIGDVLAPGGGVRALGNGGADSNGQAMDSMIAYSAIGSGTTPFGKAAIKSLFADADLLGRLVTQGKLTGLMGGNNIQNALSEIIVQNAGDQAALAGAHNGQDYSGATGALSGSTDTVLKINTDHSGGTDQTLWQQTTNPGTNKIIGVEDLVTALAQSDAFEGIADAVDFGWIASAALGRRCLHQTCAGARL